MNMQPVEYLVHFSNVLLLVSYSVRDILWLRWFAVGAAVANLPYYLAQTTVLWPPVIWGAVFMAINLYQIARIYLERRPVVLSPDEQRLYDSGFRSLRPREFVSLLMAGEWRDAAPGDRIIAQGQPVDRVSIPISGLVEASRNGQSWPLPALRKFLDTRPELRLSLQRLAGKDLATKVERLVPLTPR
jgi:hypothetical protein